MGVDKKAGTGGREQAGIAGRGAPVPAPPPAGLSALLASEDLLFRDPFADFTPSGR